MGEGEVVDEIWQMQLEDQIICMLLLTSAGGSALTNWKVLLQNLEAFKTFWKQWDTGTKGHIWSAIHIIPEYRDKQDHTTIIIYSVKNS